MAIYYLIAIVLVFLQTVIAWPFLPLVVVLLAAGRQESKDVYVLALVVGLLSDLLLGKSLGTTAVFLLLAAALIYLYQWRAKMNLVALAVFLAVFEVIAKILWR
jgi:rod shape-determining protein MreD